MLTMLALVVLSVGFLAFIAVSFIVIGLIALTSYTRGPPTAVTVIVSDFALL